MDNFDISKLFSSPDQIFLNGLNSNLTQSLILSVILKNSEDVKQFKKEYVFEREILFEKYNEEKNNQKRIDEIKALFTVYESSKYGKEK